MGRDVDLTGIEILEKDQKLMRQARSDVEKQAIGMMDRGMEGQNQTQVCIYCFLNNNFFLFTILQYFYFLIF